MVEHLLCKQGVGGSSPLVSTFPGQGRSIRSDLVEPPTTGRGLRARCRGPRPQTEVEYRAAALAPTIRAVGVLDLGVGILDRLRLSAFIPRLDIAVEGSAQLCTDEHFMVVFLPMEGELRRKTDVHIDVSIELWTKGTRRIAVLELRDAAAVRQLSRIVVSHSHR